MFIAFPHVPDHSQRRGIVLLVVMALLTIFAAVGIAFVYYADAERTASKNTKDSLTTNQPDVDPEEAFASFLQQLIFGCPDDITGVYSAMRAHSFLRNMFGLSGTNDNQPSNGTGRWHTGIDRSNDKTGNNPNKWIVGFQNPFVFNRGTKTVWGIDDYYLINYQYFPSDGFLHDPERLGPNPTSATPYRTSPAQKTGPYIGGFNPSWTYPDMSNIFLGAVKANGTLLISSFDRSSWMPAGPTAAQQYFNSMAPTNWMWYQDWNPRDPKKTPQPWLRYQVLRPRPADQLRPGEVFVQDAGGNWTIQPPRPFFPAPQQAQVLLPGMISPEILTGDVQNAIGWTHGPDSFWMYLGSPVMSMPDGRKYTMLFAPLIVDLDGRVNLNVHGNVRNYNPANPAQSAHASHEGWGPWEVNLGQVLTKGNEWTSLFLGSTYPGLTGHTKIGRYGPDQLPNGTGGTGNPIPQYAAIDFDGCMGYVPGKGGTPTEGYNVLLNLPAGTNCFPVHPAKTGYENGLGNEQLNHPALYNTNAPQWMASNRYDRRFALSSQEKLMRNGDIGTDALDSEVWRFCPQNFGNASIRQMVTLLSADHDQPALQPAWWWTLSNSYSTLQSPFAAPQPAPPTLKYPFTLQGPGPYPFPGIDKIGSPLPGISDFARGPAGATDWRSAYASPKAANLRLPPLNLNRGRLDLNSPIPQNPNQAMPGKPMTPYPQPDPTTGLLALTNATAVTQFLQAQQDRQQFAMSLFMRLIWATGAYDPSNYLGTAPGPTLNKLPTPQELATLRWLAQYAVNMVDYIDNDDYVTPFNWVTGTPPSTSPSGARLSGVPPYASTAFIKAMTAAATAQVPAGPLFNVAEQFVYGNELPRVLINEVYAEYDNLTSEITNQGSKAKHYQVNVWVELLNPLRTDPAASNNGMVRLNVGAGANLSATYQIVLTSPNNAAGNPANPTSLLPSLATPSATSTAPLETPLLNTTGNLNLLGDPQNTKWPWPPSPTTKPQTYDQTTFVDTKNPAVYNFTPPNFNFNGQQQGGGVPAAPNVIKQADSPTNGFYVIGPNAPSLQGGLNPGKPNIKNDPTKSNFSTDAKVASSGPYLQTPQMSYQWTIPSPQTNQKPPPPTVLVRRLLCPALPYQPNPAQALYNPYITVDYMENVNLNAAIKADAKGPVTPTPVNARSSVGRKQPYDNSPSPTTGVVMPQQVDRFPPGQPQHTFFSHNRPRLPKFDWMVHMDRQLLSPIELLHVASCRPHQVTHLFKFQNNNALYQNFNHAAYWQLEDSLPGAAGTQAVPFTAPLYRMFEFVETGAHGLGVTPGQYTPGKININTIWDDHTNPAGRLTSPVLNAVCDAKPLGAVPAGPNGFNQTDVDAIWTAMKVSRTLRPTGQPGLGDHPFKSLGVGNFIPPPAPGAPTPQASSTLYVDARGLKDTIFRGSNQAPSAPRLFEITHGNPTALHPVQRYELYNKIYNQITTRSNVFAVWVTVGFFEVIDDTPGQMPKLGAELGLAEGRQIRHRMFAIVDRSRVTQNPGPPGPNNTVLGNLPFNPRMTLPLGAPAAVGGVPTPIQLVPHYTIIN